MNFENMRDSIQETTQLNIEDMKGVIDTRINLDILTKENVALKKQLQIFAVDLMEFQTLVTNTMSHK